MKKIFSIIAVLVLLGSAKAFAGTSLGVDMDIEIGTILALDWNVNGSLIQLTGANKITNAEYVAGFKDAIPGGTLDISSNALWNLTVEASANFFVGGSGTKPTSDLLIDLDSASTYAYALAGISPVFLYSAMPPVTNGLHDIQYKILLTPADSAGVYGTDLTYTLTAF
jgi:hypothetical protein